MEPTYGQPGPCTPIAAAWLGATVTAPLHWKHGLRFKKSELGTYQWLANARRPRSFHTAGRRGRRNAAPGA